VIRDPKQLAAVHAWQAEWDALHEELDNVPPLADLARELGVAESTIQRAIALRGIYKQASPEKFKGVRTKRERRLARMRALFLY